MKTDQKFTRELKQREGISKGKHTIDGRRRGAYRGFRLTDDAPKPERNGSDDCGPDDPEQAGLGV